MGVKKHFILATDTNLFIGPKAYHHLAGLYTTAFNGGLLVIPFKELHFPKEGWRNKIETVYNLLRTLYPAGIVGTLRTLKASNPRQDDYYRSVVEWVSRNNNPRPQTPRRREPAGRNRT